MTNCTGTASGLTAGLVTNGVYTTSKLSALATTSSSELAGVISDETGSGALVFGTSPTLSTPIITYKTAASKDNTSSCTASESGTTFLQTGNVTPANHVVTLPATVAGLTYTFVFVGTATQGFQISPAADDKIMGSIVDIADGNIVTASTNGSGTNNKDLILDTGSKVGDRVTLIGDGTHGWVILDGVGSWAFES